MHAIQKSYQGLELLFELNRDRAYAVLVLCGALLLAAQFGAN